LCKNIKNRLNHKGRWWSLNNIVYFCIDLLEEFRGDYKSPLLFSKLFYRMTHAELKILIQTEIAQIDAFYVEIDLNMENQIKVHADLLEGHISVDQLKFLSRSIENALGDESEEYSIEVSSPGMFTPFRVPEQYLKSVGRLVKVNIVENDIVLKGTLKSYNGDEIELHWKERVPKPKGKGKMDVDINKTIPLKDVSKIVLDFKF